MHHGRRTPCVNASQRRTLSMQRGAALGRRRMQCCRAWRARCHSTSMAHAPALQARGAAGDGSARRARHTGEGRWHHAWVGLNMTCILFSKRCRGLQSMWRNARRTGLKVEGFYLREVLGIEGRGQRCKGTAACDSSSALLDLHAHQKHDAFAAWLMLEGPWQLSSVGSICGGASYASVCSDVGTDGTNWRSGQRWKSWQS